MSKVSHHPPQCRICNFKSTRRNWPKFSGIWSKKREGVIRKKYAMDADRTSPNKGIDIKGVSSQRKRWRD